MPFGNISTPFWSSLLVGGMLLLASLGVNRITNETKINAVYPMIYWVGGTILFAFIYSLSLVILIWSPTGIENTRGNLIKSTPKFVFLFIIIHSLIVGGLATIYQRSLLPATISLTDEKALTVYMNNNWRFGRLLIALSIAFMVGISIPMTLTFTDGSVPLFGLLFLWGTFSPAIFGISAFLFFRVKACQDLLLDRDNFSQLWRFN